MGKVWPLNATCFSKDKHYSQKYTFLNATYSKQLSVSAPMNAPWMDIEPSYLNFTINISVTYLLCAST